MREIFKNLTSLDWENIEDVSSVTQKFLKELSTDKDCLRHMLGAVIDTPELFNMCEHYDILDKIVLYNDEEHGFRLRLHVFLPDYFDRPHNHRWSYTSLILNGSYRHYLYGPDSSLDENIEIQKLKPVMVKEELTGSTYTLHSSMVHAVVAEPYTVTMIIRGPATKNRFLVMDRKTNKAWWQYGAKDESLEERRQKAMSVDYLRRTIAKIQELKVV